MSPGQAGVVDAHHHVWDLAVRDQDWIRGDAMAPIARSFGLDDLRPEAAARGVVTTVLVQTVVGPDETPELLALADGDPLVGAVTGWADLTSPALADDLAALRDGPGGRWLRAVRHQVQHEPDPRWLARPDVVRGLATVAAAGLAYELLVLPHQLPAALDAVRAVPEGRFVLDHCAKPPVASGALEPWSRDLRALAAEPAVTCKLSGLVTEAAWATWTPADVAPFATVVLDAFGADRVMAGSDWPVCLLAASYGAVWDLARDLLAGCSPTERDAVLRATATRVYGLGGA
ncbi:amidohydrolase [Kineosporia sp. R_H_3]|uniref:amidohydrolase family protein n=1 Tax=Kineosporia sp. R_H_3 TaxID=1961848 RepID=UPI000B4B415F|nr:amidohydrolase family protein [Kineosporia sp. R_H_3]